MSASLQCGNADYTRVNGPSSWQALPQQGASVEGQSSTLRLCYARERAAATGAAADALDVRPSIARSSWQSLPCHGDLHARASATNLTRAFWLSTPSLSG